MQAEDTASDEDSGFLDCFRNRHSSLTINHNHAQDTTVAPQHSVRTSVALGGLGGRSSGVVGALVMVYGSAEACARTQCGLTFMPIPSLPPRQHQPHSQQR